MEEKLSSALKEIGSKRTFISFAQAILENYDILKAHHVFKFHDDCRGDFYQFDFYQDLTGPMKTKFELLTHIFGLDECEQTETLLKKLGWFHVTESGFDIDQLISEASNGQDPRCGKHDLSCFMIFERREWENFVSYFF